MPIPATADAPVSEGRDGCNWLWLKWPGGACVSVDVCVRGCVAVRMRAHGWIGGWVGGWVEWAVGWVVVKLGLSGWGELHIRWYSALFGPFFIAGSSAPTSAFICTQSHVRAFCFSRQDQLTRKIKKECCHVSSQRPGPVHHGAAWCSVSQARRGMVLRGECGVVLCVVLRYVAVICAAMWCAVRISGKGTFMSAKVLGENGSSAPSKTPKTEKCRADASAPVRSDLRYNAVQSSEILVEQLWPEKSWQKELWSK